MNVSVLIIVHERPDHLRACLHALTLQTHPPAQVVVVDDGSSPACAARLREDVAQSGLPALLVHRVRTAYCPAAARNEAVRHAQHPYLLFLDCDVLTFPDVIERHVQTAKRGRFLAGNCALLDEPNSRPLLQHVTWGAAELEAAWGHADQATLRRRIAAFQRNHRLRRWGLARRHKPKLISWYFSLFKEDLRSVNGFDENYVEWGYEDDDLGLRLYQAGLASCSVAAAARALHLYHSSAKQKTDNQSRPNREYFLRRRVSTWCDNGIVKPSAPR